MFSAYIYVILMTGPPLWVQHNHSMRFNNVVLVPADAISWIKWKMFRPRPPTPPDVRLAVRSQVASGMRMYEIGAGSIYKFIFQ